MLAYFQEGAEHERCEEWHEGREDDGEEVGEWCKVGDCEDVDGEQGDEDHEREEGY